MKKIFLSALIIYSLLMITACPSKGALEKAFNQSASIGKIASASAITVGDLYRAGVISLDIKDQIAGKLGKIVESGARVHEVIKALAAKYKGQVNKITPSEQSDLDLMFSREVVEPFLDILTALNVLPPNTAKQILVAIALLRSAIMTVSGIFGPSSASYTKIHALEVTYNNAA
jgi:hypothetical protein